MYKPICPKCKSQDIGELISYVDFDVNSEGSVHEWLCQGCDYSWEKDDLKNNLNIYNQLTCKETTSDKNDSDMFNAPKGYPAVVNSWYFYDFSNKLVLIDQERTIKPLKVLNNYQ